MSSSIEEHYYLGSDGQVYSVALAYGAGTVRAGNPEAMFTIDHEARTTIHSMASFDLSPDGSRFVIPSMASGEKSRLKQGAGT